MLPVQTETFDVVDLGAGDGRLYKIFQEKNIKFHSYTALDISPNMLNKHPPITSSLMPAPSSAGKEGDHEVVEDLKKIVANLESDLPLEDNAFDLAFSFFVIEHINNIDNLFAEIERILKPGGTWIIGYFLQRREFIRKIKKDNYKIEIIKHRIQDLEKIAQKNLFQTHIIPIEEKGALIGHLLICEK
ncbi:class I SAM-dependent methyltransferase [Patescibacteria group bacterium]|nr:class I SAM-dependent methyltransferase [Patescibacteria group bacterium]